jgi:bis(5'-nucleosyl)-tetraphosphatase (symmetrical)
MSMSSIWMIGDVQGCCNSLDELLCQPEIAQDEQARFWFAGDLVNRGPQSLTTLRTIRAMENRSVAILGNHDLHLLAVAAGVRRPGKNDTLHEIIEAPDAPELIDWLRRRPMAHFEAGHLMVHAGVLAKWDVNKTLSLAKEVETILQGKNWQKLLQKMYGDQPAHWNEDHTGGKRIRVIVNALTRMRMCSNKGRMMLSIKSGPQHPSNLNLVPWFDVPNRVTRDVTVVFGHWSTLGLLLRSDAICLDTGCVWGGKLTALRLQDRKLVQVDCVDGLEPDQD